MIRHIDAGRVVDRVSVDASAIERVLDARLLGEAEVAAFDDNFRAKLRRGDSASVVGVVGDFGVGLARRANVGADAAVVKQIDRRAQNALNQRLAVERVGVASERGARLRTQLDSFLAAAEHAAAGTDELGIVVRPTRARQIVQALAFVEAGRGVGVGIDEDVTMVEGGDELQVARAQQAVTEHVARHVADADHRDGRAAVGVAAHLAQMPARRLPRAARRDPHLLVVVTVLAAGRERVAEPEAALDCDLIGDVRETRGAFVRSDDQIRTVVVEHPDARGMHRAGVGEVVGEIEHRVHQRLVCLDAVGRIRLVDGGAA